MKEIRKLIREIIPVIIGILIALFINNWNEERKNTNYLNHIFTSIKKEFKESNANMINTIPKQKALLDSIDHYLDNDQVSVLDIVKKAGGVKFSAIRNNSWKAIANSKIELIDYSQLSMLSDIDDGREELNIKNEKLIDFVFDNVNETNRAKKEVLQFIIQDVIWTEERLQALIEQFTAK